MRKTRVPAALDPAARSREERREGHEHRHPEATLRRREFIGRTAALAGAAGLATSLPVEALVSAAAKAQTQAPMPSPRNLPIDTFVVLMMENRSFDHYFGWHPEADGMNAGLSYPDADGNPVDTHHLRPDFQGCGFLDPDHSWFGGRHQYGNGAMNGFVQGNAAGTGSDEFAAGYYLKQDIGFLPRAADRYQLYDRFFHSIMDSTYANRHYMWAAQNGGTRGNPIPLKTLGYRWKTIFDQAQARGVSARYFNSDLPFSALYGVRGLSWTEPVLNYYLRASTGTLPKISFVDPPFLNGGGGDGLSADEHPHGDIRLGQAFMSDVVNAFVDSPQYRRGALFIVYDEWGGFFDHVPPRQVPDARADPDINKSWGLSGFRIPAVVVSPYVKRGSVSHATALFESILKLIAYKFGFGDLTTRMRHASNIGESLDWANPDFAPRGLPDPSAVLTLPCSLQQAKAAKQSVRPADHDLARLQTSGYLDRLGYEVVPPTPERIFREPDSVRKAAAAAGS